MKAYAAYGPTGPRAATAVSKDLCDWRRVGLINLAPHHQANLNVFANQHAMQFPELLVAPDDRLPLVLNAADRRRIIHRSPHPALEPKLPEERSGVVADVAFPVLIDRHDTYLDVHFGMAGECIGAARADLPTAGSTNTILAASHPIALSPTGAG
jgi:predicted GH43/DUF377 family glycosyl hydrolase